MKKLNELTLKEAVEGLKASKFFSVDLVNACYDQIEKHNDKIQAFITIIPREKSIEIAKAADNLILSEGIKAFEKKPLLGIPYSCKDNFNTKSIKTTASSKMLENYTPPYESTVTKKLQDAGAILLGKTNMDAFAHGSSTETSDFFTTKNPYDLNRVAGGSSGGSAAAVAANMCTFAIGSETAGSIRGPAAWCGVTGLKPTYGRVSRYGLIAMASSTDCPGPITKTVEDAGFVLNMIAGKDSSDGTSSKKEVSDYSKAPKNDSLKGVKIGVPKSYLQINLEEGVRLRITETIRILQELGAQIVEIELLDPKYSIAAYTVVQRSEVSSNLARLDGIRYGNDRTHFGFEAKKRMMLGAYTLSHGYYDEYYSKAQKVRTLVINDFNKAFEKVDVIFGPTMPCVSSKIGDSQNVSMYGELMDVLTSPSSIAGLPGISVPSGFSDGGLPTGVQFMGPQFSEAKILSVAYAFQQATDFHKKFPSLE